MQRIEKELIKYAILEGFIKGSFFSVIVIVAFHGSLHEILEAFFIGIAIACFLTFFMIYRVNWHVHLNFKEKYGNNYLILVDTEFKKLGMKKMLKEDWFGEIARQDHKGEFQRRLAKLQLR